MNGFTFTRKGLKDFLADYHESLTQEPLNPDEQDNLDNWVDLWWDDLDEDIGIYFAIW